MPLRDLEFGLASSTEASASSLAYGDGILNGAGMQNQVQSPVTPHPASYLSDWHADAGISAWARIAVSVLWGRQISPSR